MNMFIWLRIARIGLPLCVSAIYNILYYSWLLSLFSTASRLRTSQHKLLPSWVSGWILKQKSFILLFFIMLLPARAYSLFCQMLWNYGKQKELFRSVVQVCFHSNLEIIFSPVWSMIGIFRGNKGIRHLTPKENSRSWMQNAGKSEAMRTILWYSISSCCLLLSAILHLTKFSSIIYEITILMSRCCSLICWISQKKKRKDYS